MKALTVKNPWAWAIIHGGKDVENRSQRTNHRGRLFIHAGQAWDSQALLFPAFSDIDLDFDPTGKTQRGMDLRGMVIGTVNVIDCHHSSECEGWAETGSRCSKWALADAYHWVLADGRPLACPFPETGKLGLWNMAEMP